MFSKTTPKPHDFLEINSLQFTFGEMHSVVDEFYRRVASDPVLSVPFGSVADWPHHIDRLTHFWWTRLGGMAYQEGFYDPISKHFESGFNDVFLDRWLTLFREVLDEKLSMEKADLWSALTHRMGAALARNNEQMKKQHAKV